jgi:uncharacterized membrane protein
MSNISEIFEKIKNAFYIIVVIVFVGGSIVMGFRYCQAPLISIEKPIDDSVNTACLYIQPKFPIRFYDNKGIST